MLHEDRQFSGFIFFLFFRSTMVCNTDFSEFVSDSLNRIQICIKICILFGCVSLSAQKHEKLTFWTKNPIKWIFLQICGFSLSFHFSESTASKQPPVFVKQSQNGTQAFRSAHTIIILYINAILKLQLVETLKIRAMSTFFAKSATVGGAQYVKMKKWAHLEKKMEKSDKIMIQIVCTLEKNDL